MTLLRMSGISVTLKKSLLVVLIVTALTAALFLCSTLGQAAAKTKLIIGHYFTPGSFQADAHYKLMCDFVNEFKALHPELEIIHEPYDYSELVNGKMIIRIANKLAPTVWLSPNVYNLNFADKGLILDLTDWVNQADWVKKDFVPAVIQSNADKNGRIWGFPQGLQLVGLYYNTQFFEERGVIYPNVNWTWEDYATAARKLLTLGSDGRPRIYGGTVTAGYPYTGWSIFRSLGGKAFDETGTRSTLDCPEMRQAVEYMARGVKQWYFICSGGLNNLQNIAMGPDQYVRIQALKQLDMPFDVTAIPRGPKGRFNPVVANSWVITRDAPADSQRAAWEWIKYYSSVSVQKRWALYGDAAPPSMTAAKEVFLSPAVSPKGIKDYIVSMQFADWIGNNPVWDEWIFRGWAPVLDQAIRGEMDIAQALAKANHEAQVILDRYYKKAK